MNEVAALAIIFGSVVGIVFLGIVGGLIKAWIQRGSKSNLSENQEFLSALREFKEKTDRRLSNLEAIVTEDEYDTVPTESSTKELPQKKEQKSAIEIEIENEEKKESQKQSGNLRNMLNQ